MIHKLVILDYNGWVEHFVITTFRWHQVLSDDRIDLCFILFK